MMKKNALFKPLRLWFFSLGFALFCALGDSFVHSGSITWLMQHPAKVLSLLPIRLLGCFTASRFFLYLLEFKIQPKPSTHRQPPLLLFCAIIGLCWLPYILWTWPGSVSNDSNSQLRMIIGSLPLTADNPLFQTAILALFRRIGLLFHNIDIGIAGYCLVQSILLLWLLGSIVSLAWQQTSRPIALLLIAYFSLNPIFPCYAFCIGKDTNFAMAVTWLMLVLYRFFALQKCHSFSLIAACVLCILLRNAGAFIVAAVLLILLFLQLRQKKSIRLPLLALGISLVVYCCAAIMLPAWLQLPQAKKSENYSLPLQQVARIAATDGLTEEETVLISAALPTDTLAQVYLPELSDPVKNLWREDATKSEQQQFFKGWLKASLRSPQTAVSAAFHNSYGYLYPGHLHPTKPSFLVGNQYGTQSTLEGKNAYTINPSGEVLKHRLNRLLENDLASFLLAPGLYGCFTLLALLLCIRKNGRLWLAVLPAVLVLIGLLFSPVNGYMRYAMPLYLSAGVSVLCCASACRSAQIEH